MKILVIADEEEKSLWDYYDPSRLSGVEMIISCGDLAPEYLEFLVSMTTCPLFYVRGNHDGKYDRKPPLGCIDIDGRVYDYRGVRLLGLGGSMRYKPGNDMYTEAEMCRRINRMYGQISIRGGFDILVTHAPARGMGDLDDLPHMGFVCFNRLLDKYRPAYMLHGHVHQSYGHFERMREHPCGTKVINGSGSYMLEMGDEEHPPYGKTGSALYDFYVSVQERRLRRRRNL